MAADESALVPVSPDDTVQSILDKVRRIGATTIELLVPDDTAALQAPGGFARLRRAFDTEHIDVLVISSDEQVLRSAGLSNFEIVGVQGVRVSLPPLTHTSNDRYATRPLPVSAPSAAQLKSPATPMDARDAAFFDALDQVPVEDEYADLAADDADLYTALDDLASPVAPPSTNAPPAPSSRAERDLSADEAFAAALDDWSSFDDEEATQPVQIKRTPEAAPEPSRRFSAADFDLSDEDSRQRRDRRVRAARERADARALAEQEAPPYRRGRAAGRLHDYDEDALSDPSRKDSLRRVLPSALAVLIAVLLVALAWFWLSSNRVTVTVSPPASTTGEQAFTNEVLPLVAVGTSSATALQANPVSADVEATVSGQVEQETLAPQGTAAGTVTIINTIENAVPIPKGAEFIGTNARGEEVRFTLDADAVIPAAITTSSATGRNTTYGQIVVGITARSPGSASNVDTNSIKQIIIPGQQPIVSDSSNFLLRNDPIGGGSEAPQRVVTEEDVQAVLGEALSQLYTDAEQQLKAQVVDAQMSLDETTIAPSRFALADPNSYEPPIVEPAVGQVVDAANPVFTVTVRGHFSALVTPADRSVLAQLQVVVPQYFVQRPTPPCANGETPVTRVDRSLWDGEKFVIDGAVNCQASQGLSDLALGKVKDAVRNQPHDAAIAGLEQLKAAGVIGSYTLPDQASFTRFDWLIDVQVEPAPVVAPTESTEPPPAQEAQ